MSKQNRQIYNQTEQRSRSGRAKRYVGTGIFISKKEHIFNGQDNLLTTSVDSDSENLPIFKVFIPNCTYLECVRMSRSGCIVAFKWIRETKAAFMEISTDTKCRNDCVKRCAGFGCICVEKQCR